MKFNQIQRIILGSAAALLLGLTLLHNPLSGYATTENVQVTSNLPPCTKAERDEFDETLRAIYNSDVGKSQRELIDIVGGVEKVIQRKTDNCHMAPNGMAQEWPKLIEHRDRALPFSEWRSKEPVVFWVGNLAQFFSVALALFSVTAIFVFFVFPAAADSTKRG